MIDLGRLIDSRHPILHATYSLREIGEPTLEELLEPVLHRVDVALRFV